MKEWKCTVCGYVHKGKKPPEACPQCGANLNRFIMLEPLSDELEGMLRMAFAGEAKAQVRNQAFAKQAEAEGLPQVAALFKAVAEAERVHAEEYLGYLEGVVGTTEDNLKAAFESEMAAKQDYYPPIIAAAIAAKRPDLEWSLIRGRDVEGRHADLYKDALTALASGREVIYHVCQVCGFVFDREPPNECPVCLTGKKDFKKIE